MRSSSSGFWGLRRTECRSVSGNIYDKILSTSSGKPSEASPVRRKVDHERENLNRDARTYGHRERKRFFSRSKSFGSVNGRGSRRTSRREVLRSEKWTGRAVGKGRKSRLVPILLPLRLLPLWCLSVLTAPATVRYSLFLLPSPLEAV